jgi:hypothetical protein
MPYGAVKKELYHPTVDDVVAALAEMSDHYAHGVTDIGEKVQQMKGLTPFYGPSFYGPSWTKLISQAILLRSLTEAVVAKRIVVLEGRRGAAPYGLAKRGMRERHTAYYVTTENFIKAKANTEASELTNFKEALRRLAIAEVAHRHNDELKTLIATGMERYEELLQEHPEESRAVARAQVLDGVKRLFDAVVA